jgi:hypothetical protein
MVGHTFPEIHCKLCNKPVDLSADLCADEHGKAVHEECYAKRIRKRSESVAVQSLVARWLPVLRDRGCFERLHPIRAILRTRATPVENFTVFPVFTGLGSASDNERSQREQARAASAPCT